MSQNLTLQYDKVLFLLEDTPAARDASGRSGKKVEVSDYPDGRVEVRYRGALLPCRTFDKLRRVEQAPVVDNKRLGPVLEWCRAEQAKLEPESRSRKAPKRRDQKPGRIFFAG